MYLGMILGYAVTNKAEGLNKDQILPLLYVNMLPFHKGPKA
jgi:hypothetical protein